MTQLRADRSPRSSSARALAWWSGKRVAMTDMPQMIALYNGMGGGAAAAIARGRAVSRAIVDASADLRTHAVVVAGRARRA